MPTPTDGATPSPAIHPPRAVVNPTTVTRKQGQSVEFTCRGIVPFGSSVRPRWSRLNGSFRSNVVVSPDFSRLVIPDLEPSDADVYVCEVSNSAGSSKDEATLVVQGKVLLVFLAPLCDRFLPRLYLSLLFVCLSVIIYFKTLATITSSKGAINVCLSYWFVAVRGCIFYCL